LWMNKESADPCRVVSWIQFQIFALAFTVSAIDRAPFAPSAASYNGAVFLDYEVSAVTNQLAVHAENRAEGDAQLRRRIAARKRLAHRQFNQRFQRWNIVLLRESQGKVVSGQWHRWNQIARIPLAREAVVRQSVVTMTTKLHLAAIDLSFLSEPAAWISLITLTLLEIVLGIDNIVFISILAGKLPKEQQKKARQMGLMLALGTRILLLCGLAWMVTLTKPIITFSLFKIDVALSGRDLILLVGGLFLLTKSTREIHEKLEGDDGEKTRRLAPTFTAVIVQILLLDIVFSLDSVITAVGMAKHLSIMIAAVIISVGFMLAFGGVISHFVEKHPTVKMLALSFLLLIGVTLIAEAFHHEVPKGYIYFAMAFSLGVEMLNLKMRAKSKPVDLHQPYR
jgi:predicted tellurium resistance membrane protein TerC